MSCMYEKNKVGGRGLVLAIGNGEKCPFCDKVMIDFKIDGEDSTEHFSTKHPEEFKKALFGGEDVGL